MGRGRVLGVAQSRPRNRRDAHGCLNASSWRVSMSPLSSHTARAYLHSLFDLDRSALACAVRAESGPNPNGYTVYFYDSACGSAELRGFHLVYAALNDIETASCATCNRMISSRQPPLLCAIVSKCERAFVGLCLPPACTTRRETLTPDKAGMSSHCRSLHIKQTVDDESLHAAIIVHLRVPAELHGRVDRVSDPYTMTSRNDFLTERPAQEHPYTGHR